MLFYSDAAVFNWLAGKNKQTVQYSGALFICFMHKLNYNICVEVIS